MVYPTVVPELLRPAVGFLSRWSRAQPGCQNLEIQMSSEVGGRKKKSVVLKPCYSVYSARNILQKEAQAFNGYGLEMGQLPFPFCVPLSRPGREV